MKTRTKKMIGLIAALSLTPAWSLRAQAQRSERQYEHQESRIDLEFSGGTIGDYINRIREAKPDGATNVVVMPDAKTLKVPPVTLVAVTVEAAVRMLEGTYNLPDGRKAHVEVSAYPPGDEVPLVMKVAADFEVIPIRASVWSVDEALLSGQTPEELLGAIEAVLSLFPEKAKVSFHPPTQLLIARGTEEQLDLVFAAIDKLTEGAERRRARMEDLRGNIGPLEEEVHRVLGEIKVAEQELALAKTRLGRMMKAREAGTVEAEAAAEAEVDVTRLETQLDNHKIRHGRLQANLDELRDALKKLESPRE